MRRLATLTLCALLLASTGLGQWRFLRVIHRNLVSVPHGVAVSPDGKVWVCANVRSYDTLGTRTTMTSLAVLNPDGSLFRKVQSLTIGGVTDTLFRGGRGIYTAKNGDILYSEGSNGYRINSKTYAGIAKFTSTTSLTMMGETDAGEVVVGHVLNGNPIKYFNAGLTLLGNLVDTTYQIARVLTISPDGNDIYLGSTTGPGVLRYHCDYGTLGPYAVKDTVLKIACEAMGWRKGNLWMGCRDTVRDGSVVKHIKSTWYEWNPVTGKILDSLRWNHDTTGLAAGLTSAGVLNCTPRGIAFSVSGDTAYVVGSDGNALQMFRRSTTDVRQDPNVIPKGFVLEQNYPNPFNPKTEIKFTIDRDGPTTLIVYDMLGREVETLVNENMAPGAYTASFEASKLSSGTYVYRLTSGGLALTKKMMVVK